MAETVALEGPPLASGEVRCFEADGRRLVLCEVEGSVYALDDRCPHADVSFKGGRLAGAILECPLHGGKIDVRDGSPARPPIRRPVKTHAVRATSNGYEIELDA